VSKTVEKAREEIDEKLMAGESVICPCCDQHAKIYRRQIHSGMVLLLINMYRTAGTGWVYLPSLPQKSRDGTGLHYWCLIAEDDEKRDDGGRAGWWRVTERGEEWVLNKIRVPKYALIYNSEVVALEGKGTSVRDALGKKFNYRELMAA
jgi:hypothetical protein